MPDPIVLPELARSLWTFGAPHDAAGEAAHAAIFSPLLDARARAITGDVEAALSLLRGESLTRRIEARVVEVAEAAEHDRARARARGARARALVERLRDDLRGLDTLAPAARAGGPASPAWEAWVAQLRHVFSTADDACRALAGLLAEPAEPRKSRRWFRRPGTDGGPR